MDYDFSNTQAFFEKMFTKSMPFFFFADSTPPLNTLLPSPGAWPYSASDSPLNNAHNSGNKITHQFIYGLLFCYDFLSQLC